MSLAVMRLKAIVDGEVHYVAYSFVYASYMPLDFQLRNKDLTLRIATRIIQKHFGASKVTVEELSDRSEWSFVPKESILRLP